MGNDSTDPWVVTAQTRGNDSTDSWTWIMTAQTHGNDSTDPRVIKALTHR